MFKTDGCSGFKQSESKNAEVLRIGEKLAGGSGHDGRGIAQGNFAWVIESAKESEVIRAERSG